MNLKETGMSDIIATPIQFASGSMVAKLKLKEVDRRATTRAWIATLFDQVRTRVFW